jgi:hypothetical protein
MKNEKNDKAAETTSTKQHELIEEKKQNRKIDTSLLLSILALLVSILQFVVTTPFFTDFYYKASFEIEETYPYLNENRVTSNFLIKNTSKNMVNNIEVGLQILATDIVQITPNRNIQLTFKENGPNLKDCFFTIDKLVPNETVFVLVNSRFDSLMRYNKDFLAGGTPVQNELDTNSNKRDKIQSEHLLFPNVLLAKFDKGFGKVIRLPKEILFNHYRDDKKK